VRTLGGDEGRGGGDAGGAAVGDPGSVSGRGCRSGAAADGDATCSDLLRVPGGRLRGGLTGSGGGTLPDDVGDMTSPFPT